MKFEKVYAVEFMEYTNCLNDTVSDWNGESPFEFGNTNYISVGKNNFLVRESELDFYRKFGQGYRNITFVGNMRFPE